MPDLQAKIRKCRCRSLGALSLATALLAGTFGGWTVASAETLRIAHTLGRGGSENVDPIHRDRLFPATLMLYSGLVRPDAAGQPSPDLATDWSSSPGFTEWTLTLRQGVRFHDGSVFDSADAVYSLRRILSEEIRSPARSILAIMQSVEALDAHTVRIELDRPHADFPVLLTQYLVRVVSSEGREDDIDAVYDSGIGTGPFMLRSLDVEGTTVLQANPDYWEGPPGVDVVEVIAIPDAEARMQALLAGQLDLVRWVSPQQLTLFDGRPGFEVQTFPTGDFSPLVMRTDTPPFDDVRVRRALRILADREAMARTVLGEAGGEIACDTPVWPGDPYHVEIACPRDVEEARRLLSAAGYPDGLEVDLYTADILPAMVATAQVYQSQAAEAGVTVNIHMAPSDGYWSTTWMQRPFVGGTWAQRAAADTILNEAYRSDARFNETFWNRPDFDALLDQARMTADFEERRAVYGEIQRILFEDGGAFIPFFPNRVRAYSDRVSGVQPVHDFFLRWHQITKSE